jgi:outer membrane protein OmpA-like peptidoglycan-associated protein
MPRRRQIQLQPGGKGEEEKWISYADMLSALVLIFALFLMFTLLNQKTVDEREKRIEETRKNIEATVGVKEQLIQELVAAFRESSLKLEVDEQTGAIRFSGGVFFGTDSSQITSVGRDYLEQFFPKYISILMSDKFRSHIGQVIVEGHTDRDGDYLYNLKLSQDRALSVAQTILDDKFQSYPHREELKTIITANGRSFAVPILNNDGTINADRSRRVEFKFRLKEDEMLDQIEQLVVKGE